MYTTTFGSLSFPNDKMELFLRDYWEEHIKVVQNFIHKCSQCSCYHNTKVAVTAIRKLGQKVKFWEGGFLGNQPMAPHILGTHSNTELYSQPSTLFL